jgi:hypothetical protein
MTLLSIYFFFSDGDCQAPTNKESAALIQEEKADYLP